MSRVLYLDMDGVLANFDEFRLSHYGAGRIEGDAFKKAVLEDKIFKNLNPMPSFEALRDYAEYFQQDIGEVYVLTSVGSMDQEVGVASAKQKTAWLLQHDIYFKPIFVCTLEQKGFYGSKGHILVDDNTRATNAFTAAGGYGLHHTEPANTVDKLQAFLIEDFVWAV